MERCIPEGNGQTQKISKSDGGGFEFLSEHIRSIYNGPSHLQEQIEALFLGFNESLKKSWLKMIEETD